MSLSFNFYTSRNIAVCRCILSGILLLVLIACNNKISKTNQALFHGGETHSGVYQGNGYKKPGAIKWTFKTEGKIFSSPSISNDKLFIGSQDGYLYALGSKTGRLQWKFKTNGAIPSTPLIHNGIVYFLSYDGYLYAIAEITGKELWKFKTGGEKLMGAKGLWGQKPDKMYMEDLYDFFLSSPVVNSKDKNSPVFVGSSDGNLYALNATTGKLQWKFKTNGKIHSSPAIDEQTIFVTGWDTYLYAIDIKTGKEKWRFKTLDQPKVHLMEGIQAAPVVKNGIVYFGARDAWFYAVNAQTGKLLWKVVNDNSWILTTAAISDSTVFYGTSDSYWLMALNAKTGKEQYRVASNGYIYSSPVIAGNTLYYGDFTGQLFAVDLYSNGKQWSSFSTPGRKQFASDILNKNGKLDFMHLAGKEDPALYSTSINVMDKLYQLGPILSSPVVHKDVIYFGSADSSIYAVKLNK